MAAKREKKERNESGGEDAAETKWKRIRTKSKRAHTVHGGVKERL